MIQLFNETDKTTHPLISYFLHSPLSTTLVGLLGCLGCPRPSRLPGFGGPFPPSRVLGLLGLLPIAKLRFAFPFVPNVDDNAIFYDCVRRVVISSCVNPNAPAVPSFLSKNEYSSASNRDASFSFSSRTAW